MSIQVLAVIGVILFSSSSFARNDFGSLIENSNKEGQAVQQKVKRAVSSNKDFQADVVSAKRVRAYNPVTYNPMASSDGDVEVIVHRDADQ
ncbi:hypothetical protein DOM22_09605 [Bdellovibrio sp. ZAP7]|uniref:hypothetical protein n=1 Tax=Bdellovibrio sp. ZAP7 TaxID=2231053 RepID=UPI00115B4D2D|nr:hypothetical protein [Bdellovibrio sp. ZAP7]QDK45389.1 hypothetical protein DOM22_09605 [Bdellovibrio sp. ZAP7]